MNTRLSGQDFPTHNVTQIGPGVVTAVSTGAGVSPCSSVCRQRGVGEQLNAPMLVHGLDDVVGVRRVSTAFPASRPHHVISDVRRTLLDDDLRADPGATGTGCGRREMRFGDRALVKDGSL